MTDESKTPAVYVDAFMKACAKSPEAGALVLITYATDIQKPAPDITTQEALHSALTTIAYVYRLEDSQLRSTFRTQHPREAEAVDMAYEALWCAPSPL